MALQPSIRVINGRVFGAYAAQAKNVSYGNGSVEDSLDAVMPRTASGTTLAQLVSAIGLLSEEQKNNCSIAINGDFVLRKSSYLSNNKELLSCIYLNGSGTISEVRLNTSLQTCVTRTNTGTASSESALAISSWTLYYQGTPIS